MIGRAEWLLYMVFISVIWHLLNKIYTQISNGRTHSYVAVDHGPLTRYEKIASAHAQGNAGKVFPATGDKQSRHASRHVRDARAVTHAGIANWRFPLESVARENVPGIPGACAPRNFTYLARGPLYEQLLVMT